MKFVFTNFAISPIIFEDTKMVDHILKISRPGVFDIRRLSWNTAIVVFIKKCRMVRRRYKSRHWISMFIGTPCIREILEEGGGCSPKNTSQRIKNNFYFNLTACLLFFIILFSIKQLNNSGRWHFKLFTNCHVSWDTLYLKCYISFLRKI